MIHGQDFKVDNNPTVVNTISDFANEILATKEGNILRIGTFVTTIRALPNKGKDIIAHMQTIRNHTFIIVKSTEPMIIIGEDIVDQLNYLRFPEQYVETDYEDQQNELNDLLNNALD